MSLIGLDIGTTGCKAIFFDNTGNILGQAAREYAISFPQPNWAEQDAEYVFKLALETLSHAAQQVKDDPPIALALSCQGEAIIPVDKNGLALRPAILGMDTRTTKENEWLEQEIGGDELFRRTGMPMHTINTLPKLLWLRANEPELWQQADQFLLYEDFIIRRLTGQATISHCLASRTQMYDLAAGEWADDILQLCHIEKNRLARLAGDDGFCGEIKSDIARRIGLPEHVKIFAGGHDQACAALGSGVIQNGRAMVSTGTAEVVEVVMATPVLNASLRDGGISVYKHVVPGLYLAMTLNHSGGLSLRWFRDTCGELEKIKAEKDGRDAYELLLHDARVGPTGIFVLPHFSGSGTPRLDTSAKAAILGLTFEHTKADMAKAVLEGLCYELRLNIDLLRNAGVDITELAAVGGGAKSPLWLQLKADICDVRLKVPDITEAACCGAAMLAGIGAGVFADAHDAVARWIQYTSDFFPADKNRAVYDTLFTTYKKIYPALSSLSSHT